ncbi:hypothetical protein [Chryseobacterium wanjuense]
MKNLKAILVAMLVLCIQNLKSQNILQPETVFNLYFNSFVKYDDDSLKELNSYLINFLGKDNTYRMNLRDSYQERVDYFTQIFLSNLPADVASSCKKEAQNYFSVLVDNFKDVEYTIKSIKSIHNKYGQDENLSEIVYEAKFKVPSDISGFKMADIKTINADAMKEYLASLTAYFKNADKIISVEQTFNLYEVRNGRDTHYWNGGLSGTGLEAERILF